MSSGANKSAVAAAKGGGAAESSKKQRAGRRSVARSSNSASAAMQGGQAPTAASPPPSSSSAFSKIHLSALFQRRQGKPSGDEAEEASQQRHRYERSGSGGKGNGSKGNSPASYLSPPHDEGNNGGDRPASPQSTSYSSPPPGFSSPHKQHARSPSDASGYGARYTKTWSGPPPASVSSMWRRRKGSTGSTASASRVRRMSSSIASLFSPRNGMDDGEPQLDPLLTEVFAIPDHIAAFNEALQDDAGQQEAPPGAGLSAAALGQPDDGGASAERDELQPDQAPSKREASRLASGSAVNTPAEQPTLTQVSHPRKIGRIAAASDFAPVYERTQAKRTKVDTTGREGMLYKVCQYPLLILIFLIIALEFAAYVLIRQLVNVNEYLIAWRGHKGTLRKRLRRATTSDEWRDNALELDSYLGYEQWKCEDASGMYDWILIKKVLNSLRSMREADDAEGVMSVLELCLRNNFAGIENFRLYSETFFGTKYLVESYLSEVEEALAYVASSDKLLPAARRGFYRGVQKNMGRSALCLSGGGAFGYYHVGVVRALLDANLLPSIITGTSAGGLIAALACTRTNDELKRVLVPELADRITACEEPFSVWGPRAWRTGARFDLLQWAQKSAFFTMGSMTFAEAYARTGKVLNISVIPSDRHSPVKLLNYHTAPNCIIWSSLLASAAVPGLLNPVCLMQKTRSGQAVPWNWGHRFKDGSLRVDIPLQDLHSLFNVNYPIVSQVNPHVHLFFFAPKGMPGRPVAHRKGKGWRGGFLLSASEHVLKLNLSMNFKIIRDLDLLPSLLGQDWSSVFLQRFGGAVTIWPKTRAMDWVRILSDPDRRELTRMMHVGQGVTFPKLHMIENRVRLERAIEQGRRLNRRALRETQKANAAATTTTTTNTAGSGDAQSAGDGGPTTAGPMTQSDTDGTGDDFFSARQTARPSFSADGAEGSKHAPSQHHLRRLQRQLTNGFSRVDSSSTGLPGRGGGGDGGGDDTPDALLTPGEASGQLPRHIRVRSMGLDEDDDDSAQVDYAHQDDEMSNLLDWHRKTAGGASSGVLPFPSGGKKDGHHSRPYRGSSRLRDAESVAPRLGRDSSGKPLDEDAERLQSRDFAQHTTERRASRDHSGHAEHMSDSSSSGSSD